MFCFFFFLKKKNPNKRVFSFTFIFFISTLEVTPAHFQWVLAELTWITRKKQQFAGSNFCGPCTATSTQPCTVALCILSPAITTWALTLQHALCVCHRHCCGRRQTDAQRAGRSRGELSKLATFFLVKIKKRRSGVTLERCRLHSCMSGDYFQVFFLFSLRFLCLIAMWNDLAVMGVDFLQWTVSQQSHMTAQWRRVLCVRRDL